MYRYLHQNDIIANITFFVYSNVGDFMYSNEKIKERPTISRKKNDKDKIFLRFPGNSFEIDTNI